MLHQLRYDSDATARLNLPDEIRVTDCSAPHQSPLDDLEAALSAALATPLNYPPLAQAVVAGDQVVLALDRGVPRESEVVAGIIAVLLAGSIAPGDITILLAAGEEDGEQNHLLGRLPENIRRSVRVVTHDPADFSGLAYVAASKQAHPIYVNRVLSDADVVIPVSTLRLESSLSYWGPNSALFPAFSDQATQQRFRVAESDNWSSHERRRRQEVDEAAWLLGVQFSVQLIPGPGDSLLHVLAGESKAVREHGRELAEAAWVHRIQQRFSLVVAAIEGGPEQQTWESFARALFAASAAVAPDGAIVLCTGLRSPPGPALRRLVNWSPGDALPRQIRRDRAPDPLSATMLAEVRKRSRVYLLSKLDEETVEELGIGCVTLPAQIDRLSRNHDSCLLLGSAQHAVVVLEN